MAPAGEEFLEIARLPAAIRLPLPAVVAHLRPVADDELLAGIVNSADCCARWSVDSSSRDGGCRIRRRFLDTTRVDGQWSLIVNLKRAGIQVLVIAEVIDIDLHLGDDALRVPTGSRDHPSVRRAHITRERQAAGRQRLQIRISP